MLNDVRVGDRRMTSYFGDMEEVIVTRVSRKGMRIEVTSALDRGIFWPFSKTKTGQYRCGRRIML